MPNQLLDLINAAEFDAAIELINSGLAAKLDLINKPGEDDIRPIHAVTDFSAYSNLTAKQRKSYNDLAILLIKHGADLTITHEGLAAPHYVCDRHNGSIEVLEAILNTDFDVRTPDIAGDTVLDHAVKAGASHRPITERLLKHLRDNTAVATVPMSDLLQALIAAGQAPFDEGAEASDEFVQQLFEIMAQPSTALIWGAYLVLHKIETEQIPFDSMMDIAQPYFEEKTKYFSLHLLAQITESYGFEQAELARDAANRIKGEWIYDKFMERLKFADFLSLYRKHNQALTLIANELRGQDYTGSIFEDGLNHHKKELTSFFEDFMKILPGYEEDEAAADPDEELGFDNMQKSMLGVFFKQLLPPPALDNILEFGAPLLFAESSAAPATNVLGTNTASSRVTAEPKLR